ncbi:hypothetical protein FR943_08260 [Mycobacterium sp. TNTM28]|uniref:Keratin associated protein n=1 Tax=[Mycobacterium] fortunisiensis TaxID=2600579 RepID=A0ABS6KK02_9MYCO|nr:hypothetical protein [[Mycobacterium] fortunisiensis]MBU9763834.1 hypothetical protein [[Mycobacterium] fortunisiensis]
MTRTVISVMAGALAAVSIAMAPNALAEPTAGCRNDGGSVVCQTPGNAQVYSEPPITSPSVGIGSNGPYGPWGNLPPEG